MGNNFEVVNNTMMNVGNNESMMNLYVSDNLPKNMCLPVEPVDELGVMKKKVV